MAQATAEVFEFPAGGIADFYMEDHEIEALEREEAKQEFGSSGIATFEPIAKRMASYGRFGDDTVAHVETGELVVPKALIDDNPRLRDSIFSHLRELGIEDPERYVVGSGVNSINPETGMPEFFNPFKAIRKVFSGVKKAASKIAKGVKKTVKKVAKVVKKVAPLVLPFVLGPAGLGLNMMYAGALGAGIGTLIQGGSIKDAVTAGLIGGAIGGVSQGVSSGMAAGKGNFLKGFTEGVKNVATNPMQSSFTQAMSSALPESAAVPKDPSLVSEQVAADTAVGTADKAALTTEQVAAQDVAQKGPFLETSPFAQGTDPVRGRLAQTMQTGSGSATAPATFSNIPETPGFFESVQDAFTPGSGKDFFPAMKDAFLPSGPTAQDILAANNLPATQQNLEFAAKLAEKAGPDLMRTFLPGAAVGAAGLYAAGAFDPPKPEDEPTLEELQAAMGPTGEQLLAQDPDRYGNLQGGIDFVAGPAPTTDYTQGIPNNVFLNPFIRPVQPAAKGGEIFPRRVGGIMPDEGTPGKDSVRAMLMPGEFVMTTKAVKGLGDGDNNKGINRMYDMMRSLEAKGKAMA